MLLDSRLKRLRAVTVDIEMIMAAVTPTTRKSPTDDDADVEGAPKLPAVGIKVGNDGVGVDDGVGVLGSGVAVGVDVEVGEGVAVEVEVGEFTVIVTALEAGDVTGVEALSVTVQVMECECPAAVYE